MLNPSQVEDFNAAIVKAGFEVDDFTADATEDDPGATEQYIPSGTVTIRRISKDIAEKYRAGSGSNWPQEFENDLRAGKFGQP